MINVEKRGEDIFTTLPSGRSRCIYKPEWRDLTLFFTNDCNSRCIMCPQVSDDRHGNYLETCKAIIDLRPNNLEQIGITGGEPTLYKSELLELLSHVHSTYPRVSISLLTNGRSFIDSSFVKKISEINHRRLMIGVPLYAANYEQHNEIVGSANAFQQTVEGLFNLYRFDLSIEIRMVVFKYNYAWLTEFASFIWRNFPFVHHIAFMGMEYVGSAAANRDSFWIDPYHFKDELDAAVNYLHRCGMNVSIYNTPLVLLNENARKFARDSISRWKKKFFGVCDRCSQQDQCSGWFATSSVESEFIRPIP